MSTLRPRPTLARRTAAILVAGALPLGVAACGASRDAQTYQEKSQADATNTAVGTLAVRGLAVLPPEQGRSYPAGTDAEAVLVVANNSDEPDTLEEVTTDAASSVEILVQNRPATLEVPSLGSTRNTARLRLVGLTDELREGEYVTMTLRFANNGTIEVPVPVAVSGRTDRPVYTAEEGSDEEPALQAPAGGHESDAAEEQGDVAEAEMGQDTDKESPREGAAEEPVSGASEAPSVAPSAEPGG